MRRWLSCAVLCVSMPAVAAAAPIGPAAEGIQQSVSPGVVRGRVLDSSSAAIAGAQVTVTSDRPGTPVSVLTNQQGEFEIPLAPGGYTVRVSATGFAEATRRLTLSRDMAVASDFRLAVAGIQEAVD